MNQILDKNYDFKKKTDVEFSTDISEIPFIENTNKQKHLNVIEKSNYKIQFFISSIIAILSLFTFSINLIKNHSKEKISKKLLNNYNLTTIYQNNLSDNSSLTYQDPFVVGLLNIDKIDLNYPIISQTNDDLLKISLCRFAGPFPNQVGNLCIVGHNYIDNRFFSRIDELSVGDKFEIYDLNGDEVIYTIYDKFEVDANDLSCTDQTSTDKKIVTLITCNNFNNSIRLILKAKAD